VGPRGAASNGSFGNVSIREVCGVQAHVGSECQLGQLFQDLTIE